MVEFSVVIPIYNTEKYIGNLIESLIKQTYKNFETILVNDGSTDNSIEIADNLLSKTNLKYIIINKENGGQSTARNAGLKASTGKWITMIDSDDYLQPDYLEKMLEASNLNKELDVIICDINYVKDNNLKAITNPNSSILQYTGKEMFNNFILHKNTIGPCQLCIKEKFIKEKKLVFNVNSKYSEEFTFICDLLYNSKKIAYIEKKLYNYCLRKNSVSTSTNIDKVLNGYNEIIKSNYKYIDENCQSCILYNKFAMARWILATARFTSKTLKYKTYIDLLNKLNYKEQILKLIDFPDLKTKLAAITLRISPILAYYLFKII